LIKMMLLKGNSVHKAAARAPAAVGPRVFRVRPVVVVRSSSEDQNGGLPESNGVATKLKEQEELVQVRERAGGVRFF
jgi:hypothetical protein